MGNDNQNNSHPQYVPASTFNALVQKFEELNTLVSTLQQQVADVGQKVEEHDSKMAEMEMLALNLATEKSPSPEALRELVEEAVQDVEDTMTNTLEESVETAVQSRLGGLVELFQASVERTIRVLILGEEDTPEEEPIQFEIGMVLVYGGEPFEIIKVINDGDSAVCMPFEDEEGMPIKINLTDDFQVADVVDDETDDDE